jgi:glycosyltransferase involved in cell wall biosynthesis
MIKQPILSVAIATKNRVQYCIVAIEAALALPDTDIELVVQDNTDDRELEEYIHTRPLDERLVYHYTPPPLSFIDNFNAAIELATGEYICIIGDDDAVLPQIVDAVRWAKNNDIDSLCSISSVSYIWPNALSQYPKGHLYLRLSRLQNVYREDPVRNVKKCIENGAVNYYNFKLPRIYHGIIRKKCMDKIKERTGHYFGGLSPDIYSSISLSYVVKEHIIVNHPLTIAGVCEKSTSADAKTGRHSGTFEDIPHLRGRENYVWDIFIPKFYSVQTIWAESAIAALKEMGENALLACFNYYKFFVFSFHFNKSIYDLVKTSFNEHRRKNNIPKIIFHILFYFTYLKIVVFTIIKRFINIFLYKNISVNNNIKNIQLAAEKAMSILHNHSVVFWKKDMPLRNDRRK